MHEREQVDVRVRVRMHVRKFQKFPMRKCVLFLQITNSSGDNHVENLQ